MKLSFVQQLITAHSDKVVFWDEQGSQWIFCIGDAIMDDDAQHEMFETKYGFQDAPKDGGNVYGSLGYGDEYINAVVINNIDLVEDEWLELFLTKFVGENCYTNEEDYDEDEDE